MIKLRMAAAAAAGLVLAMLPAVAASAASGRKATVVGNDVTVSPGGVAKSIDFRIAFRPYGEIHTVVVDLSAASRLAEITPLARSGAYNYDCSPPTGVLTCSTTSISGADGFFSLRVAPLAGATVGDAADLPVRVVVNGATVARDTVRVTVGEGVDLAYEGSWMSFDSAVGKSFDLPPAVRNIGTKPVAGAVLFISKNQLLRTAEPGYRNCVYDVHDFVDANDYYDGGAGAMACTFDTALAPGRAYHLSAPIRIHLDRDVWTPATTDGTILWFTPQDWADQSSTWAKQGLPLGRPGTGATLRLEETATAQKAAPPQTDETQNNYQNFRVFLQGDNRSNLTAQGTTVTGTVGQTIKVRVGVRNQGPARLDYNFGSSPQLETAVALPPGVTVVKVAPGCGLFVLDAPIPRPSDSPLKQGDYECGKADPLFLPRTTLTWEFTVRLDREMSRSKGQIFTWLIQGHSLAPRDPNPSDDAAPIYVTAVPPSSGGGGGGGGLPITGNNSALLALAAGLLIVAGAAARLLARRP